MHGQAVPKSRPRRLFHQQGDARERGAPYLSHMQFPDSTFAALNLADEPMRFGRLLALAVVLTLAAVSAGLLVGG